jgi:hypothetical protein
MYVVETLRQGVVRRFATIEQAEQFVNWYEHNYGEMFITKI